MTRGSLLIVEGNVEQLRREGHLRLIDDLEAKLLRPLADSGQLRFDRLSFREKSEIERVRALSPAFRYNAILLVMHGDTTGVEVASGYTMLWSEVGEALAVLEPKAVLAVACEGAASEPTEALFSAIPTLQVVGGSPLALSVEQAFVAIVLEFLRAAQGVMPTHDTSAIVTALNAFCTDGIVLWRHRASFVPASPNDRLLVDVCAELANDLVLEDTPIQPGWRRRKPPPR